MCVICEIQATPGFVHRRQLLLGTAAALLSFGAPSRAASAGKPLQVGGLPVT